MRLETLGGRIKRRTRGLAIPALAALVAVVVLPIGTALAAPPTPAAPTTRDGHERLERLLQREQRLLATEERRLDLAAKTEKQVQKVIDNQKAKGRDTTRLEAALADFNTAVDTAKGKHDKAADILNTHAGFGANGEVTDVIQARVTVKTAGQAERKFHQIVGKATSELRKAIREFRQANRATPTATPTPG